jgi:hypothetical protein
VCPPPNTPVMSTSSLQGAAARQDPSAALALY